MITMSELAASPASARRARLLYEDLTLVAHLSELERSYLETAGLERRAEQRQGRSASLMELLRDAVTIRPFTLKRKRAVTEPCC